MNATDLFYNIIGVMGSLLLLFGFYRTSIGKWTGKSFWYELDNLLGATFIIVYQIHHQAYITMVLNVIWGLVAFRGLTSYAQRRAKR
jgi:hypothetical protein